MNSKHETLLIVSIACAVFFGAIAGGVTAALVSDTTGVIGQVGQDLVGALSEQAGLQSLEAEERATIAVVERVAPSVVSILIEKSFDGTSDLYEIGGGTGFFVSSDGLILTNKHVVRDPDAEYIVVTSDDVEHPATVLAKDLFLDLAVVKISAEGGSASGGEGFPAATLGDSDQIQIGQTVIAIGNTLSEFRNSVTKGIISGIDRTIIAGSSYSDEQELIEQAIQTDAAISEGNSGGPLINLRGEVIGVNTAVSYEGQSLGFAIPINVARSVVDDVITYGRIVRPWLGVRYVMIDPAIKEEFDLSLDQGALILLEENSVGASVIEGSPADKAGLQPGDVILSVDGVVLDDANVLGDVINGYNPGDQITLLIDRDGTQRIVFVTLEEVDETKL